jgi:hypothetical protein
MTQLIYIPVIWARVFEHRIGWEVLAARIAKLPKLGRVHLTTICGGSPVDTH